MATTFCGSVALSAAFPGFVAVLSPLRGALASLRAAVQAALIAVASARADVEAALALAVQLEADLGGALGVHLDALASFRASIRLAALVDLEVQLQAALALEASLGVSISDPAAYISGLISAVASVQVDLSALVPQVAVSAQLSAALALRLDVEAKIAAFDLVLDLLVGISASLTLAVNAVLAVSAELRGLLQIAVDALVALSAALQAAFDLTTAPLSLALDLEADLSLASVEVYRYDGTVSDLAPTGYELGDAIAADSLLPGGTVVRTWLLMAPASATDLVNRLTDLLKSTP